MRIDLTNYNAMSSSVFRIYRSYSPFTAEDLPPRLAEIPATSVEYYDNTVELNRLVYYRISVVHGNIETVGNMYTTVRKYFTGPHVTLSRSEPDTILRGDARCGRYGTMTMAQVYPASEIPEDFPTLTIIPGVDVDATKVEKCIYNDKVIFIPRIPMYSGSLSQLYQAGVLFDTYDGDGVNRMTPQLYDSLAEKVTQGKLVHAKNCTYRIRLLTTDEYNDLYVKLFPSSRLGGVQDVTIGNAPVHQYETVTLSTMRKVGNIDNATTRLNGSVGKIEWNKVAPLTLVLELVNRSDSSFPQPDVEFKPSGVDGAMQYCGGELVNDRVHFFGGIPKPLLYQTYARKTHISYNLDGGDLKIHANMPVGVYKPITWVHDNKIYCFGGYYITNKTIALDGEIHSGVQVWEDDGTPEGKWTEFDTNLTFDGGAAATVYYDSEKKKEYILIMGARPDVIPNMTGKYHYAPVEGFTGKFSEGTVYLGTNTGGGVIKAYDGNLMVALMSNSRTAYSGALSSCSLPLNPPDFVFPLPVKTQGSELIPGRGGKMHIWRDTLILFPQELEAPRYSTMYAFQWAPQEFRWLKILLDYDVNSRPTSVFNGKRVYQLITPDTTTYLAMFDLIDPVDAPLTPIVQFRAIVNRIYAPYFEVAEG